jgi:hypothetical protein
MIFEITNLNPSFATPACKRFDLQHDDLKANLWPSGDGSEVEFFSPSEANAKSTYPYANLFCTKPWYFE